MNTHRQIALSNPDEHIASEEMEAPVLFEASAHPYRRNTWVPVKQAAPFNWGPLQRTAKLGLVALPLIAQFILLVLLYPHTHYDANIAAASIFLTIHFLGQCISIPALYNEFKDKSGMYGALTIAWWPIALLVWLFKSRLLFYPITRPIQYIRSGE